MRRLGLYYRQHGAAATIVRCREALRQASYMGRMILYRCQLPPACPRPRSLFHLERVDRDALSAADRELILGTWTESDKDRLLHDRFAAGSELWLGRCNDRLAGYGWTLRGKTIEPHFFPLQLDEAHLYDFFVFPAFRGQGLNVALVNEILARLASVQVRVAHIESAAWNRAQIRSLRKTPFLRYAEAAKFRLFRRSVIVWHMLPSSWPAEASNPAPIYDSHVRHSG